jgi:hypothetical protein
MITETGYIETLNEAEAIKHGNYLEINEEVPDESL